MVSRVVTAGASLALLLLSACAGGAREPNDEPVQQSSSALVAEEEETQRIRDYIERLAPLDTIVARRTLNDEDVDCVDFYSQRGAQELLQQGKSRESLRPTTPRNTPPVKSVPGATMAEGPILAQACPKGSVPRRRITVAEILSFGGLDAYLHRAPPAVNAYEYAATRQDGSAWGAGATINLWSPSQVTGSGGSQNPPGKAKSGKDPPEAGRTGAHRGLPRTNIM